MMCSTGLDLLQSSGRSALYMLQKTLLHVHSYYEILINAKSLQYFMDAAATKFYRTFLSPSSVLGLEFKCIIYIINGKLQ